MAKLFQVHKSGISRHLKSIFEASELQKDATVANFATVQEEAERKIVRDMEYFNLEMVIARGYRINSHRGTQFRIWATNQLKELDKQLSPIEEHFLKVVQEIEKKHDH